MISTFFISFLSYFVFHHYRLLTKLQKVMVSVMFVCLGGAYSPTPSSTPSPYMDSPQTWRQTCSNLSTVIAQTVAKQPVFVRVKCLLVVDTNKKSSVALCWMGNRLKNHSISWGCNYADTVSNSVPVWKNHEAWTEKTYITRSLICCHTYNMSCLRIVDVKWCFCSLFI